MIRVAIPVVQHPDACVEQRATWDLRHDGQLLIVDNTRDRDWEPLCSERGWDWTGLGFNLGISGGWNVARSWYLAHDPPAYGMLLLASSSVVWRNGLRDATEQIRALGGDGVLTDLAWHAIAFAPYVLRRAGTWDENLWPGYYNDNDYGRRLELLGYHGGKNGVNMPKLAFEERGEATCETARALKAGLIDPPVDFVACERYMEAKWGEARGHGELETPFGLPVDVGWWSPLYRPGL